MAGAGQRPLLTVSQIRSLHDLHSFFHSVSVAALAPQGVARVSHEGTAAQPVFSHQISPRVFFLPGPLLQNLSDCCLSSQREIQISVQIVSVTLWLHSEMRKACVDLVPAKEKQTFLKYLV